MVVHLFAIVMQTPDAVEIYYTALFEIVAFDWFDTAGLYDEIFHFENLPLTERLGAIGYESQYIIYNLGTIFLFMIV